MKENREIPNRSGRIQEFKVYDDQRRLREWTALIGPTQCAVLFKDVDTSSPLTPAGSPVAKLRDTTFLLFDHVADARQVCETLVQSHQSMCCEIFDSAGRAKPALLTIVHPSRAKHDESSSFWLRRSKLIVIVSAIVAVPLFAWDWYYGG